MTAHEPFQSYYIQKGNIFAIPIIHYNMETAAYVRLAFDQVKPDCIAVELAETMQLRLLHAASRLPDISVVISHNKNNDPLYYLCEPCDAAFEALRSALESRLPAYCIDLDIDFYPDIHESIPDPYAIQRIGLKNYYEACRSSSFFSLSNPTDNKRELYMAKRLKELSLSYDRILFVGGMAHIHNILHHIDMPRFPTLEHAQRDLVEICSLTEDSCRDVMAEFGWISAQYEKQRQEFIDSKLRTGSFPPDRQKLIYQLYKHSSENYIASTGNPFPGYNWRNLMKFARNYSLIKEQLMPNLYQILTAAKGCVDHNYAYETWLLATEYPHRKNVDGLNELDLSIEDVWGNSKIIRFHTKEPGRKGPLFQRRKKDRASFRFHPPGPFSICSYPPEDVTVERFGNFLKKKGTQILTEEAAHTIPFGSSIEDGVDMKETIRHYHEKKLYVKVRGRPPGGVGSIVVIFDSDQPDEENRHEQKYPWHMTWLGEHEQESDMAFYATPMTDRIVGPGISRCEYGGFMMSYPPRRMYDVWSDPDYNSCRNKAEVLLMAAIDYAIKPLIVYVASAAPRGMLKSFAKRFGKKIIYIPIGQLGPTTLNKIRVFHVLDGRDKRPIADEYIF